jgi:FkbM family methyltransferase
MSRTHAPSGWMYRTRDPEDVHEELWGWVKGSVGWDIGANEGQSADRMLANGFSKVLAVEPAIESFRILEREWGDDERVELLNAAVSDVTGVVALSVRATPMGGGQLVSPELPQEGWHGAELYQRSVRCTTLDDMAAECGRPDFVKIDTEGFEEQILRGGAAVIEHDCDWMIEYHSEELRRACYGLLGSGYIMRDVSNPESSGNGWLLAEKMISA